VSFQLSAHIDRQFRAISIYFAHGISGIIKYGIAAEFKAALKTGSMYRNQTQLQESTHLIRNWLSALQFYVCCMPY